MMKKLLFIALLFASFTIKAQQKNTLLEGSFWKTNPDVATVKAEIEKGNSPTEFNPNAFDATTMAINSNASMATIRFLLEQEGNSIDKKTHDGRLYLHWAANKGNVELVEYLIAKGSDINLVDTHGNTPITFAANNGQATIAIYEAFIKAGLDIKKKYRDGANLLLLAAPHDDKDLTLTNYFISKGLSLKDVDDYGNTAFNYAAKTGNLQLLRTLQKKKVKYNDQALIMAAQGTRRSANSLEVYQYLVDDLKLKPGVEGKEGETVLHYIVRKPNQAEIIKYFLAKGVDVNKADKEGNTAFMHAAAGSNAEVVALLLPNVKDINVVNENGESALTAAVKSGSSEIASLLINNGADINVTDKDGNNLAYYLIQSYRPQGGFGGKMELLQEKGLNLATAQKDGSTLYHIAIAKNDLSLLKQVSALQLDVNAVNSEGLTVLHKAAMLAKDDTILKYLLSIGANKEIATEFDETAFMLAQENEVLAQNNISVDFLK